MIMRIEPQRKSLMMEFFSHLAPEWGEVDRLKAGGRGVARADVPLPALRATLSPPERGEGSSLPI